MDTKTCRVCKIQLPKESFSKDKRSKDGLQGVCKSCYREYYKKNDKTIKERSKKYRTENNEQFKKYLKEYYQNNRESELEKAKIYYQENREEKLEYAQKYSELNKDSVLIRVKKWRQENPEKHRINNQRRRAKKRELTATLTDEQWERSKYHFNKRCAYCGKNKKLTQDHFIPLSKNGEYTRDNIIPACFSCNSSKNNKDFFEWYPKHKFYSKQREQKILSFFKLQSK